MKFLAVITSLLASSLAYGQATLQSTTFSAAVTDTTTATVRLTSTTGLSARMMLYADQELMLVNSVSSTGVSVGRGSTGTQPVPHASGATVYFGPSEYFTTTDRAGVCTSSRELVLPRINVRNGNIWNCTNGLWTLANLPKLDAANTFTATQTMPAEILGPKTIGSGANQLPAAASCSGCITIVTDASSSSDCTSGSGSSVSLCRSNGTTWAALGGGGGGTALTGIRVYNTAAYSSITGGPNTVNFDTNDPDSSWTATSWHSTSSNTSRITVPTTGVYMLSAGALVSAGAGYAICMNITGTSAGTFCQGATGVSSDNLNMTLPLFLTAGDYVELQLYVATSTTPSNGRAGTFMSAIKLGF